MPRDLLDEHRLAVEGLRMARHDYVACRGHCVRRLRDCRAWVQEATRRLNLAKAAIENQTRKD